MNGILFLTVMIFLLLAGVPVAYGLGISALLLMLLKSGSIQFHTVAQMSVAGINSFTMLCVPLFLLAGKLMNTGGITKRLFDFAKTVVGFLPGGLGHVNIVSSVICRNVGNRRSRCRRPWSHRNPGNEGRRV